MRHTIGASDLSSYVYSYDNVTAADTSLSHFSLGTAGTAMLTVLEQIKAYKSSTKILGSMWSPPGWMKLNNQQSGTASAQNVLNPTYETSYAQYFVDYIQAFAKKNVTVDAITIQNEPLNNASGFPTMYMTAANQTSLIEKYVGPALAKAGLKTAIWAYDHNTGTATSKHCLKPSLTQVQTFPHTRRPSSPAPQRTSTP